MNITEMDAKKNKEWLQRKKHGGCIYSYISNPKLRSAKCRIIFPNLERDKHRSCGYCCPCDQYKIEYVEQKVKKFFDNLAGVAGSHRANSYREVENG